MRIAVVTSFILAALTTTVAARGRVPRSLLVGLKRQAATSPVIPEGDYGCTDEQSTCGVGGEGCCDPGTECAINEDESGYICALDTSAPTPEVEGTEPTPPNDETGTCDAGFTQCSATQCCETSCLPTDPEETTFVCAFPEEAPPPEETTSTEDIVTSTPAPRPPPTGNNSPTPTRTPNRSTTSSRSTGSTPTNAPGDGAGSITGKSAAVVAGLVGAMMALA